MDEGGSSSGDAVCIYCLHLQCESWRLRGLITRITRNKSINILPTSSKFHGGPLRASTLVIVHKSTPSKFNETQLNRHGVRLLHLRINSPTYIYVPHVPRLVITTQRAIHPRPLFSSNKTVLFTGVYATKSTNAERKEAKGNIQLRLVSSLARRSPSQNWTSKSHQTDAIAVPGALAEEEEQQTSVPYVYAYLTEKGTIVNAMHDEHYLEWREDRT